MTNFTPAQRVQGQPSLPPLHSPQFLGAARRARACVRLRLTRFLLACWRLQATTRLTSGATSMETCTGTRNAEEGGAQCRMRTRTQTAPRVYCSQRCLCLRAQAVCQESGRPPPYSPPQDLKVVADAVGLPLHLYHACFDATTGTSSCSSLCRGSVLRCTTSLPAAPAVFCPMGTERRHQRLTL